MTARSLSQSAAVLAALFLLAGCATNTIQLPYWFTETTEEPVVEEDKEPPMIAEGTGIEYQPDSRDAARHYGSEGEDTPQISIYKTPRELYKPRFSHKALNDYAEQLAMELVDNARMFDPSHRVGIATFVALDETLQRSNIVGNQLAESLIREMQVFGVGVVDFKTANSITVHSTGDFVFSRDAANLASELAVDHVLSGTLISTEKGVRVNARMVSMAEKIVVSSASVVIPAFLVAELNPAYAMAQ